MYSTMKAYRAPTSNFGCLVLLIKNLFWHDGGGCAGGTPNNLYGNNLIWFAAVSVAIAVWLINFSIKTPKLCA